eukprot:m.38667 g.38667  ORF g.38667 m.38667 type:complete len:243 (+) comp11680_c0_seq1:25-753(+)
MEVVTDSTVRVTLKHGRNTFETFLDRRLLPDQVARAIGLRDERLTIIHKGRKLRAGDALEHGSTLLVMCSTGLGREQQQQHPDDSKSAWRSWLATWTPPFLKDAFEKVAAYLQTWWMWYYQVAPANEALVAVEGEVYDLKVHVALSLSSQQQLLQSSSQVSPATSSQASAYVTWTAADCGEFVDNSDSSKTIGARFAEELHGPGPWDLRRALLSNGLGGVVTCEVRESNGTQTHQNFWLREA